MLLSPKFSKKELSVNRTCQIIEDDHRAAAQMREVISTHFPDLQLFPEIHTLAEARMELVTRGPDLLITDINLQEGEIFELLQEIMPVSFRIIFVTA